MPIIDFINKFTNTLISSWKNEKQFRDPPAPSQIVNYQLQSFLSPAFQRKGGPRYSV